MTRLLLNGGDWHVRGFLDEAWRREGAVVPGTDLDRRWHAASVPGSVAHDLVMAGVVPDPYAGGDVTALEWVPQRSWVYRKEIEVPAELRNRRVSLVFEGLDYAAAVYLNGEEVGTHRSQFAPARFEVEDRLAFGAANLIAVVLDPAPHLPSQHGRTSEVREHKTRMSYGWDVCPRLPHLGIWDDAYLEATGPARLEDVWVRPMLDDGLQRADVRVSIELSSVATLGVQIDVRIRLGGDAVAGGSDARVLEAGNTTVDMTFSIEEPELWWPNGYGGQPLYEAEVRVRARDARDEGHGDAQSDASVGTRGDAPGDAPAATPDEVGEGVVSHARTVPFGVRSLAWAPNETPAADARPYTVVVNGTRIYLNGWNWVPTDLFYGIERPAKLERLLDLALRAHVNLLRVWGGGLIERQAFYELCDRYGIMVWQEFIQTSSSADRKPASDPGFLDLMRAEAEAIVPQKRNHPALVLWCGGNELESLDLLPLDDDEPVLALLRDTVARLDPDRLWLPTSATGPMPYCGINTATHEPHTMHDVHGPWHHQGLTGQHTLFNRSRSLLHSEFGAEGLAHERTIHATVPEAHHWPPQPDDPAWAAGESSSWLRPEDWREAFGEIGDLPTLVRATQALQAEGVRYAVEANRRRKFENSGSLPWMFSEPYPQPAGNAAIDWYVRPKPVYHAVGRAYAPVSVTARFATQAWAERGEFEAAVWVDSAREQLDGAILEARLIGMSGQTHHRDARVVSVAPNAAGEVLEFVAPLGDVEPVFFLDLRLTGALDRLLATNRYAFSRAENLAPFLALPATTLEGIFGPEAIELSNTGRCAALFVWLEDTQPLADLPDGTPGDNHFCLLPGETRAIPLAPAVRAGGWRASGWNTNALELAPAGGG